MADRIPTLVPLDFDLERIAERARRRDEFAKAALHALLVRGSPCTYATAAKESVLFADFTLAALDAAAGPTSVEVPPAPQSRPAETERP